MTQIFNRILKAKIKSGKTWDEIAHEAGIKLSSWMTGIPTAKPTDEEIKRMAPVLGTTYEWLKNGKE